jgi:uncharacterized protein with NRDE domain
MCLLALFFRVVDDASVVVGANREEAYARGGEPPQLLAGPIPAVAGIDPQAGGTWLGVNGRGVLVAVTNRPKARIPVRPRSRGLLARDLLGCSTAQTAAELAARELRQNDYAGCNFLCVDVDNAVAVEAGDRLEIRPLPPGLHVMTAHDVNDTNDVRIGHALRWLSRRRFSQAGQCVLALQELCAQTGGEGPPMCLHSTLGGTVSSSIVVLRPPLGRGLYLHAQGPPDRTRYGDYSALLKEVAAANQTEGE